MPNLPASFHTDSQRGQQRDRDVVCRASAWPSNNEGEMRIKMCIKPNETWIHYNCPTLTGRDRLAFESVVEITSSRVQRAH